MKGAWAHELKSKSLQVILTETLPVPVSIIGGGLLNAGTKAIMYGKPQAMKSIASKRLLLNVGDGQNWLGLGVPRHGVRVLYVQLEIPEFELQERIRLMANGKGGVLESETFVWNVADLKLDQPKGQQELEAEIEATRAELVIVDPIYKVMAGDMSQAIYVNQLTDYFDKLIRARGISVLLIHHQRKGGINSNRRHEDDAEEMIGSFEFGAWPDTVINVKRVQDGVVDHLTFRFEKARHARRSLRDVTARIDKGLTMTPTTGIKE